MTLVPKNWSNFQHYKDRKPIWIKLHRSILDDYDFHRLPTASKALAPLLWLLASEYKDGKITASLDEIAFRFRTQRSEIEKAIKPLIDNVFFIDDSNMLATSEQVACLETETETETDQNRVVVAPVALSKTKGTRLSENWKPSIESQNFAISKIGGEGAISELDKFRDYWLSVPGQRGCKLDWDRTWKNWIRNSNQGNYNGSRGPRSLQNDSLSVSKAADRLIDATKRGEFTIAPRPSLLPSESQSNLRLLPKG